jgi:hypothetical protein
MLRFLLSMAESDLEHMRASYAIAQIKMVQRGGYSASFAPVGYRRLSSGRLRPHARTGPLISELFRRRADGWPLVKLCGWLEEEHVLTARGNPGWNESTMANLVRNRVYLGEVRWCEQIHPGAHPPLTDPATWEVAQRPRQPTGGWSRCPALLAGLVRCASCSMTMSPSSRRDTSTVKVRSYGCRGHSASGRCPDAAYMTNDYLEPYVELATLELLRRRRRAPEAALRDAQAALSQVERDLAAYRDSPRLLRVLGEADFAAGLEGRVRRAREARARVASVRAQHAVHDLPPTHIVLTGWAAMSVDRKREIIEALIDCVFVAPGRLDIEHRITVCPRGTAPARLPRGGDKGGQARPFRPRRQTPTANASRSPYLWSQSHVEHDLRRFLRGRTDWPDKAEFQAAGATQLHLNVVLGEGERWWAYRQGRTMPDGVARAPWTEQRVRRMLELYLADKRNWPCLADFERDGMHSLRQAMITHGGLKRWAIEFPEVGPVKKRARCPGWSEQRIHWELSAFLKGRDAFPARHEFMRADQESLYEAARSRGGLERWAHAYGLPTADEARRARRRRRPTSQQRPATGA